MAQRILLGELIHELANKYQDKPCLTMAPSGKTLSYRELDQNINRLGHGMLKQFFKRTSDQRSDYVAIMLENSFAYIEMSYALKKINRIEVSVNRAFRGQSLARMINLTSCEILLTSAAHFDALADVMPELSHLTTLIVTDDYLLAKNRFPHLTIIELHTLYDEDDSHITSSAHDTDPAVIMFTSGTTGVSKGCTLSHRYAVRTAENMISPFRLGPEDVNYTPYPLSHIGPAFYDFLPSLMVGGRCVMRDGFSLSNFWPEAVAFGVTWFMCLGSVQQLLYSAKPTDLDRAHKITRCWATPAPVPKDAFDERFGLHLLPGGGYGSTDAGWVVVPQWDHEGGLVLPHYEIAIVDDHDDFLPAGTDGELVIRPKEAGVMADGYFGMPDRTVKSWRNLWFHTGDIGRMDDEGRFYFRYRKAERIRVRGEMVSGFEVEEGVLSHEAIEDAAAIAVPAALGEEDIRLFVTVKKGCRVTEEELRAHCSTRLAKFQMPKIISFIDKMPRTPTGKPEKAKLAKYPL